MSKEYGQRVGGVAGGLGLLQKLIILPTSMEEQVELAAKLLDQVIRVLGNSMDRLQAVLIRMTSIYVFKFQTGGMISHHVVNVTILK